MPNMTPEERDELRRLIERARAAAEPSRHLDFSQSLLSLCALASRTLEAAQFADDVQALLDGGHCLVLDPQDSEVVAQAAKNAEVLTTCYATKELAARVLAKKVLGEAK